MKKVLPIIAVLLLLGGGVWALRMSSLPERSDIVLIIIDTCRRDGLSCYGCPYPDNTPRLDELARTGVRFERAISTAPWTLPSVASMLTSQSPTIHGAFGIKQDITQLRDDVTTGTEFLREAGYQTHAIVNAPFMSPTLGLDRGFNQYDYVPARQAFIRRAGECVNLALDYLKKNRGKSDFLLLHVFDPHLPYDPPGKYRTKYTADYRGTWRTPLQVLTQMRTPGWMPPPAEFQYMTGLYYAEIAYVDEQMGRFFDGLRELGLYDHTDIIVTSDHGEEFHEHGMWEHGQSMYEELVHVPLLVKPAAKHSITRSVVEAQVSLIDLMPTIVDMAGESCPAFFEGQSFLQMITSTAAPAHRTTVSERVHLSEQQFAMRDDTFSYIFRPESGGRELYNWHDDPRERTNLADAQPEAADALHTQLMEYISQREERAKDMAPRRGIDLRSDLSKILRSLGYLR